MLPFYILGALVCLIIYVKDKELLSFKLESVSKFLTFMVFVVCYKLTVISFFNVPVSDTPMPFWSLSMVWWEDAIFSIPIYLISKSTKIHKFVKFALILVMSLLFGFGHIYQGIFAVFVTSLYPYYISTRYGKDHGFGTVMACHIIYDMTIYSTIKLAPFIVGCLVQ